MRIGLLNAWQRMLHVGTNLFIFILYTARGAEARRSDYIDIKMPKKQTKRKNQSADREETSTSGKRVRIRKFFKAPTIRIFLSKKKLPVSKQTRITALPMADSEIRMALKISYV